MGTPYCVTVQDSTLTNGIVTLRNRDTTLGEFLHISEILKTVQRHLESFWNAALYYENTVKRNIWRKFWKYTIRVFRNHGQLIQSWTSFFHTQLFLRSCVRMCKSNADKRWTKEDILRVYILKYSTKSRTQLLRAHHFSKGRAGSTTDLYKRLDSAPYGLRPNL